MPSRATNSSLPVPSVPFVAGVGLLLVAIASTGVLATSAVLLWNPPGCGPGSGCAEAARSPWAQIPGVEWPISVLSFAYFAGLFLAWIWVRGPSTASLWVTRAGALGSLFYLVIMFMEGTFCPWCFTAHVANFAFLGLAEWWARRGPLPTSAGVATIALTLMGLTTTLLAIQSEMLRERILPAATPPVARTAEKSQITPTASSQEPVPAELESTVEYPGRHRHGPEDAPLRIVVYSDYQCPDCQRVDRSIRQLLAKRSDVSVSSKHFPMCADCNQYMKGQTLHPNACWAARAAETAALLHGGEGFRRMHTWLFDRRGSFTDQEIVDALHAFGWDSHAFLRRMQSPETLNLVRRDVDEAKSLGVFFTPLVFVNGVELNWRSGRALEELVKAIAASDPPAAKWDSDPLPLASEKVLSDWATGRTQAFDFDDDVPVLGRREAPNQVVVWGDLSEENTGLLHRRLQERIQARDDLGYRFLHFPMNQDCNPDASASRNEQACAAAQAAIAAFVEGGDLGFATMVDWLVENRGNVTQASLVGAARELYFDAPSLLTEFRSVETAAKIRRDASRGKALGVRFLPMLWVNGRLAERWRLTDGGGDLLDRMLDDSEASEEP